MGHLSEKVFITGIEGFTGKHLSKYLKNLGFDVYGSVLAAPKNNKGIQCDITDIKSVKGSLQSIIPD